MDRNPDLLENTMTVRLSLPARGAWIEIPLATPMTATRKVAPREGSVDRNCLCKNCIVLLKGVAPREGSVDRNLLHKTVLILQQQSLPARGAWIEIKVMLQEGERNLSLPARGAWIEMDTPLLVSNVSKVAPREGSVDRNLHQTTSSNLH